MKKQPKGITMTELLKMDFRVKHGQRWGKWSYDAKRLTLDYHTKEPRDPDNPASWFSLRDCCTASEVLDWIAHFNTCAWAGRKGMGDLLQALDEILGLYKLANLPNGERLDIEAHLKKRTKDGGKYE